MRGQPSKPLTWLHCDDRLKMAGVGSPLGGEARGRPRNDLWKCTEDDAEVALRLGIVPDASAFLVVSGLTVWEKRYPEVGPPSPNGGGAVPLGQHPHPEPTGGLREDIRAGRYEVVPQEGGGGGVGGAGGAAASIWEALAGQTALTRANVGRNLEAAEEAWRRAGPGGGARRTAAAAAAANRPPTPAGRREERETLARAALQSWVATVLLDDPAGRNISVAFPRSAGDVM